MSDQPIPTAGAVVWRDLTVGDAEAIQQFYHQVVGWTAEPLDMGDYDDFVMKAADGESVAGVCHARGVNAALPAQWLMYVAVPDLTASLERCVALGDAVVDGPRGDESSRFAVIRDPAGAVMALIGR